MENTKTKFRPILFSTPMVQAILENRKTMTRRVVKPQPESIDFYEDRNVWFPAVSKCPYEVGDVLWVRETWQIRDSRKPNEIYYKAFEDMTCAPWKPSIFMPKSACRIFLKIKSIKVERLQDISENDAIAEGVKNHSKYQYECYLCSTKGHIGARAMCEDGFFDNACESFRTLWKSINGQFSWHANPFVFVYEFERIEKPLYFN